MNNEAFIIHEFRDRAALMRDMLESWFDHPALNDARDGVHKALADLQTAIEGLDA